MTPPKKRGLAYHHGDLRAGLLEAARAILEKEGLAALSLRAVARKAGVSHAAPYRHFPNHEALLVELSKEGLAELREVVVTAAASPGSEADRIAEIGGGYMRFVARRPALMRLMFSLPNRDAHPEIVNGSEAIGLAIGGALGDPALGLAVWAAAHGLAMLVVENIIDLGQRRAGPDVLPSRAEILLRSLFARDLG
ncbi:MAG: TetR family transcriptional regulator [Rhizomicrobium sp.]